MITIEFVKRTRINSFWLMPGTRAEFVNAGQAGYFLNSGAAQIVKRGGRKGGADVDADSTTRRKTGNARRSKAESAT